VSVGRYPDKRPDSRQGVKKPRVAKVIEIRASSISLKEVPLKASALPCNRDWQPEANRRTPLSTGDAT